MNASTLGINRNTPISTSSISYFHNYTCVTQMYTCVQKFQYLCSLKKKTNIELYQSSAAIFLTYKHLLDNCCLFSYSDKKTFFFNDFFTKLFKS